MDSMQGTIYCINSRNVMCKVIYCRGSKFTPTWYMVGTICGEHARKYNVWSLQHIVGNVHISIMYAR